MKNTRWKNKISFFLVSLLILLLLCSVLFLMNFVRKLLYSDAQVNLTEVVTQNKDVITSKLQLEVNNLDLIAKQVGQLGNSDDATFQKAVADLDDPDVYIANREGIAFFSDGSTIDIFGRRYFQYAIAGKQNISERFLSRKNAEDCFAICVPLYINNEIVGTVQRFCTPKKMYELCSVSIFSSQGSMYIINSAGYILMSSQTTEYSSETENYIRNIYAQGNEAAAEKLEKDIQQSQSGFMETHDGKQKIFSAYTPIEDIHDWYLISSVSTDAVSANANAVIKIFYVILCLVTVVFAGCLFYFLAYKNRQQSALEKVAFNDTITQGNTFNKFLVELSDSLLHSPQLDYSLLSIDIDNFRYVNNYYGFDFGDRLLREIYESLQQKLTQGELLARVSGDHFVLVLKDVSEKRMQTLLPFTFQFEDVTVYLSAGMYHVTDRTESINLMMDKATTAARSAKETLHKKLVTYTERFDQQMIQNEQLKRQMEQAIIRREVIPYYQPKVNVTTGELVGAEALARWIKEDGQMVSPGEFIPLCEKTGQIMDLDLCIFDQVLEFLARNLETGVDCAPISVNFSRLHLLREDFIHDIVERMEALSVPPQYIEIELTESVFFHNHEMIISFANHLHEHGLLISMDDFGSGYSSLNLLKDIPIDVLKIDRAFLNATPHLERQRIILSTIAQMAKQLKTSVVVEGVETMENVMLMKEFGCNVAQGYFFARPMKEEQFQTVYKAHKVSVKES